MRTRWVDYALYRRLRLSHAGLLPDFAEILRQRRADLGLTRAQVADRAGCHESTVWRLEQEERTYLPRRDIFYGLAGALGLTALEMLEAAGYLEAEAVALRRVS